MSRFGWQKHKIFKTLCQGFSSFLHTLICSESENKKIKAHQSLVTRIRPSCLSNCYLTFWVLQRDRKVRLGVDISLLCLRKPAKLSVIVISHVVSGRDAARRKRQSGSLRKSPLACCATFLRMLVRSSAQSLPLATRPQYGFPSPSTGKAAEK